MRRNRIRNRIVTSLFRTNLIPKSNPVITKPCSLYISPHAVAPAVTDVLALRPEASPAPGPFSEINYPCSLLLMKCLCGREETLNNASAARGVGFRSHCCADVNRTGRFLRRDRVLYISVRVRRDTYWPEGGELTCDLWSEYVRGRLHTQHLAGASIQSNLQMPECEFF